MAKIKAKTKGAKPSAASEAAAAGDEGKALVIPTVAKGAMQTTIGPMVVAGFAKANADYEQANAAMQGARAKQYDMQSALIAAVVTAAKADKTFDLSVSFGEDTKAKSFLNNKIGIALGWRTVVKRDGKDVMAYHDKVKPFFVAPTEDKDSPEYKRVQTFRTNFSHRLSQAIQNAAGIIAEGHKMEIDKETRTLRLSGPGIKKKFGAESVLLNEKQTQENKKGEDVKLKEKPSFTSIATAAGEKIAGKVTQRGGHGTNRGRVSVDPAKAIVDLAKGMVAAIEKLKEPYGESVIEALQSVVNAIDAKGVPLT